MAKRQSQLRREMSKLTPTVSSMCIALSTTLSFALPTAKARLSPGLCWQDGLPRLKKNTLMQPDGSAGLREGGYDLGLRKVKAYVKGPGNGRESAIRTVHGAGIEWLTQRLP